MSTFTFRPATREAVSLLIGCMGASGSGKTFSAMRLATGLAAGKRFAVIDTEAGRAKHYADTFAFDHGDLKPPFRPAAYAEAIAAADAAGYPVIVVDSCSHEHAGDGGLLDWHEEELQRMAGDDYRKREACKMAAWIKPKGEHKRMVGRLLQIRAHLILCFRAEQKIEMAKGEGGRWEVRPKQTTTGLDGWVPICEKTLPYELTASFLLTPDRPGIPHPIKLQEQHRSFVPLDKPLDESVGKALAAWASGGKPAAERPAAVVEQKLTAESSDGEPSEGERRVIASLDLFDHYNAKLTFTDDLAELNLINAEIASHRTELMPEHLAELRTAAAAAKARTSKANVG